VIDLDLDALDGEQRARATSALGRALLAEEAALARRFATLTIRGAAAGGGRLAREVVLAGSNIEGARLLLEHAILLWIAAGDAGDPLGLPGVEYLLLGPAWEAAKEAVARARASALEAERAQLAPGLPWNDRTSVRAWVGDVETLVDDLVSVAEDQTDPADTRMHGYAGARALIDEAAGSLRSQLAYALRGLAPDQPEDARAGFGEREAWLRVQAEPAGERERRAVMFALADGAKLRAYAKPEDVTDGTDGAWLRVRIVREEEHTTVVRLPFGETHTVPRTDVREP
jgi:hypothetical protein